MAATRSLKLTFTKDTTTRSMQNDGSGAQHQGSGAERHWIVGRANNLGGGRTDIYRVFAQIDESDALWKPVLNVVQAELVIRGTHQHIEDSGNSTKFHMRPISSGVSAWSEGNNGENSWTSDEWINPKLADTATITSGSLEDGIQNRINVISLLRWWAPSSVKFRIGGVLKAGLGHTNRGFRIWSDDEDHLNKHLFECASRHHSDTDIRPFIEVIYEVRDTTPVAQLIAPVGGASVSDMPTFTVGMIDEDPDQRITAYEIEVRPVGKTELSWNLGKTNATDAEKLLGPQGQCSIVAPTGKFGVGKQQEWRAKVWDNESPAIEGAWTAWAPVGGANRFTVTGGDPTWEAGTIKPSGATTDNMAGVVFEGQWSHPQGKEIASLRIQLRPSTAEGSPLWDGGDNAWDTGDVSPTLTEQSAKTFNRRYAGDSLPAGAYSWRVMVTDVLGAQSVWGYGTVSLTVSFDQPDPGAGDNVGYSRRATGFRIILRAVDTGSGKGRGPGKLRAVIEDALNVGMSSYASAPGECYFTLPATHPQVGECEPYKTHVAYEQYRNGKWQEIWAGLLTDFDATGDDCVVNGIDYLGLLSLDMERRAWKKATSGNPVAPKYFQKSISSIIANQLDQARTTSNSPTGFITRPPQDSATFQPMATTVTIDASYRQRLEFIRGLIDSHRAGTGSRARIVCRRKEGSTADETHGYGYEWNLLAESGTNRKALRLEWGSLVQGFRILGFGDFGVKVLGIGREVNELKPYYKTGTAPVASGSPAAETVWGNIAKAAVWQDIDDEFDLQRRVDQLAAESAKVGKRMALGLRVRGLAPFDGWDVTDSIPIDIVRGVVDTGNYAPDPNDLSWWTIWGTEWRWYPDGHDELTLVVRPREDLYAPNPDLVIGKPFTPTPEWIMEPGIPDAATMSTLSYFYLDTDTDVVYELTQDEVTGAYAYVEKSSLGGGSGILNGSGPPGPTVGTDGDYYIDTDTGIMYGPKDSAGTPVWPVAITGEDPDTTPPGVVTNLVATPTVYLREDGTLVSGFDIDWDDPAGVTDIGWYDLEFGTDPLFGAPAQRAPTQHPYHLEPVTAQVIETIDGVAIPVLYYFRVRVVDLSENRLEWDDPVTPPPVISKAALTDPWAPDIPKDVTPSPIYRGVSLSWPRVDFPDLSRYGVRYTGPKRDDDGVPIVPHTADTDAWVHLSTLSTRIVITNLDPLLTYWFEVRAIDRSGQVRAYADPPTNLVPIAVYASQEDEAGWSERTIGVRPEPLAPDDVSPDEDVRDFLATGTFDADLITTGTIKIDNDPHIEAFDAGGNLTARWDALGVLYLDPGDSSRAMWITESEIRVSDQYTGDVGTTIWRVLTSAEGISASDIHWGIVPGGHNLLPNAGFELFPFPTTVNSVKKWDVAADWGSSVAASDVNVTKTGADLTLANAGYT